MDEYYIRPGIGLKALQDRIHSIFVMAKLCGWSSLELNKAVRDQIGTPMASRTPRGNPRHSKFMRGFAYGLQMAEYENIWRNEVEFCYRDAAGVIFSNHDESWHKSVNRYYDSGRGSELGQMECAHLWKNTHTAFTDWSYSPGACCTWNPSTE